MIIAAECDRVRIGNRFPRSILRLEIEYSVWDSKETPLVGRNQDSLEEELKI